LTILHIGGVPEHFNLPWRDLIDRLESAGSTAADRPRNDHFEHTFNWRDFPGGTGAMLEALGAEELEVAVLLTEGAVAGIARGVRIEILSTYVESPLLWGVHVPPGSGYRNVDELEGARFAISRLGSGSHLMALALASERGWTISADRFVLVGSLGGAIAAFAREEADVFLWERFMTQPVVDRGDFCRVGEFVGPWPAFVTCARRDVSEFARPDLQKLIQAVGREAAQFARSTDTPQRIAKHFGIDPDQATTWLSRTQWSDGFKLPLDGIAAATNMLKQAGVIVS
jgi:sulfonate transport system substrate-binding protein